MQGSWQFKCFTCNFRKWRSSLCHFRVIYAWSSFFVSRGLVLKAKDLRPQSTFFLQKNRLLSLSSTDGTLFLYNFDYLPHRWKKLIPKHLQKKKKYHFTHALLIITDSSVKLGKKVRILRDKWIYIYSYGQKKMYSRLFKWTWGYRNLWFNL